MVVTVEMVKDAIGNHKRTNQIKHDLERAGFDFIDQNEIDKEWVSCDGIDFRIETGDPEHPMIRVFHKRREGVVVWEYTKIDMTSSGIPTFMPSGRDTFKNMF